MPIHFLTSKSNEIFDNVPENDKRKANKETKGASKICDEGVPVIDEELSQDGGTQRPIEKNGAEIVEV